MNNNWNIKTLGTVAKYVNGRAFKPSEWEESGLPIIRIQNLTGEKSKYNYSSMEHEGKYRVRHEDLLFAWSASLGAHIWENGDAWLNQHIFHVIPNVDICKDYLYYFLKSVVADLYSKTHGSGMVHITKSPFMATKIPVPSLSEQQHIVIRIEELFSELDRAVETLQSTKLQLAVYRQAVLKEAFEGRLTKSWKKQTNAPEWKRLSIGDLLTKDRKGMTTGPFGTMLKKQEHRTSGVPVLGIENIGDGCFVDGNKIFITSEKASELDSFKVQAGDIIISRSGTVGEICIVPTHMVNALLSTNLMRISLNLQIVIPEFFVYLFRSRGVVIDQVKELCKGSTRIFLNQTILKSIMFPIPSFEEQKQIIIEVEGRVSVCDNIKQIVNTTLEQAEAMRQSILKKAFEGRL